MIMPKSPLTYLVVLLSIALSACVGPTSVAPPTPTPTTLPATSTPAKGAEPTAAPIAAEGDEPGCSVAASIAPEPLANSPIPTASTTDWRAGPDDAKVTIIEYGDFQ